MSEKTREVSQAYLKNPGIKIAIIALLAASVLARFSLLDYRTPTREMDQVSVVWHPQLYRLLMFGHTPAAVDLELLKFLVDSNLTKVKGETHPRIFYYLDLATDLDPRFFSLYTAGTNFLAVARDDSVGALHLIEKGNRFRKEELPKYPEAFKNDYWYYAWRIPFILGYVQLFERKNLPAAAEAYREMETYPELPDYLKDLAKSVQTKAGIYGVGMRVLKNMILDSKDERIRAELERKRNSLVLSQYLLQLNETFAEWLSKNPTRKKRMAEMKWKLLYSEFAQEKRVPARDPWGGRVDINDQGNIDSETPREKVMGMD